MVCKERFTRILVERERPKTVVILVTIFCSLDMAQKAIPRAQMKKCANYRVFQKELPSRKLYYLFFLISQLPRQLQ